MASFYTFFTSVGWLAELKNENQFAHCAGTEDRFGTASSSTQLRFMEERIRMCGTDKMPFDGNHSRFTQDQHHNLKGQALQANPREERGFIGPRTLAQKLKGKVAGRGRGQESMGSRLALAALPSHQGVVPGPAHHGLKGDRRVLFGPAKTKTSVRKAVAAEYYVFASTTEMMDPRGPVWDNVLQGWMF
ncbi:hypothetical protein B0H10DRAFT_1963095 [Mycena sp. CBHHK59/15]|nr:hypothetical protein B0H10DRAFT_1963095 [Mycena sp. CBHHK59/15]